MLMFFPGCASTNDARNIALALFDQDKIQPARDLATAFQLHGIPGSHIMSIPKKRGNGFWIQVR
jgi:hypothetical protein